MKNSEITNEIYEAYQQEYYIYIRNINDKISDILTAKYHVDIDYSVVPYGGINIWNQLVIEVSSEKDYNDTHHSGKIALNLEEAKTFQRNINEIIKNLENDKS